MDCRDGHPANDTPHAPRPLSPVLAPARIRAAIPGRADRNADGNFRRAAWHWRSGAGGATGRRIRYWPAGRDGDAAVAAGTVVLTVAPVVAAGRDVRADPRNRGGGRFGRVVQR